MKLLLDTHALLWFALDDSKLSATADGLIVDPANEIWVSPATHWELAIKISIGKYSLPPGITINCLHIGAARSAGKSDLRAHVRS